MAEVDEVDEIRDRLADTIANAMPGNLVTKWVTVVEVVTPDGERNLLLLAPPDQMAWDTTGLLVYAATNEGDDE